MDCFFDLEKIAAQREYDKKELLNLKIDIEEQLHKLILWENDFNFRFWVKSDEEYDRKKYYEQLCGIELDTEHFPKECSEISLWLRSIRPSYIGPAYNFNKYIDALIKDIYWDDIKYDMQEDDWISSSLREAEIIIELQNCLMLIKMGLDRIVTLFSLYYKGFSPSTTFGHININEIGTEKGKNFMAYVMSNKDKDELFMFLYKEYNGWIKECVRPRDAITHYQDFRSLYVYDSMTGVEFPIHYNEKKSESIKELCFSIERYVNRYYAFFEEILKVFIKKEKK